MSRDVAQEDAMSVAWFFFGVMVTTHNTFMVSLFTHAHMISQIKSMAQHLHQTEKLKESRDDLYYQRHLWVLSELIAAEIAEEHIKRFEYARKLNTSLAFFFMDALSLMDRGFVLSLIHGCIKKVWSKISVIFMSI